MKKTHSTTAVGAASLLSFGLLALVCSSESTAQTPQAAEPDTYTWAAELVAFDQASDTATLKARVVGESENVETAELSEGSEAMLTWSGISFGSGIRAAEAGRESSFEHMTMPVEFVSTEEDGRNLVFRVTVPAKDAAAIAELEPSEWVTATSPAQATSATEAVLSMRPYGDAG